MKNNLEKIATKNNLQECKKNLQKCEEKSAEM